MGLWKSISTALVGLLFSKKVCYHDEGIGCFSSKKPFDNAQGLVPQSPSHIQVEFLLFTRNNRNNPHLITRNAANITRSNFRGSRDTKFIIHGYNDDGRNEWVKDMADAFLEKEDLNVIAVNWKKGAEIMDYRQAVANARVVGAMIAELMKALQLTTKTSYDKMHLIGHSLGAHVAGYAGERAIGTGRITGLDPAGPLFENKYPNVRLDSSDAVFVDVIHTDGDSLLELGFGLQEPVGHVDFYPNGGTKQPGCKDEWTKHLLNLISGKLKALKRSVSCSHKRAQKLFTESIRSTCSFKAYPCENAENYKMDKCNSCRAGCAKMGYHAEKMKHGTFYLTTSSVAPFCVI